jgi:hypothetical protein
MCFGGKKPKAPKIPPPPEPPPTPPPPEPTPTAPEISDRRKAEQNNAAGRAGKRSLRIDIGGVSGGSGVNVPGA